MRVYQETIPDIDRYLANYGSYELKDKTPEYERYLSYVGKLRKVDASMRILEVGTGTGWFPLLCKANGLQCKGLEISPQLIEFAMQMGKRNGIVPDIELGNVEDNDIGVGAIRCDYRVQCFRARRALALRAGEALQGPQAGWSAVFRIHQQILVRKEWRISQVSPLRLAAGTARVTGFARSRMAKTS